MALFLNTCNKTEDKNEHVPTESDIALLLPRRPGEDLLEYAELHERPVEGTRTGAAVVSTLASMSSPKMKQMAPSSHKPSASSVSI